MVTLGVLSHADFVYAGVKFETIVAFRLKDACYLEIHTPLAGLRLPPPGTVLNVVWQQGATQWQQSAAVSHIDLAATPLLQLALLQVPSALEMRRLRRYQLNLPLTIAAGPLKMKKTRTQTEDISDQGLRCRCATPLPEGSAVDISLTLPHKVLRLKAEIVRCSAADALQSVEIAMLFAQTPVPDYQALKQFLASQP